MRPLRRALRGPGARAEDLAGLYQDADFASSAEARLAARVYGRWLRRFVPRLPDRVGAVDIGTGDGAFLHELLAAGFTDVVGIEPSTAPIAAADPCVRPLIRQGLFRADSCCEGSLSLVTCFQTIEHVADPLALCRAAYRALKPGGALFLVGHNRRAFSARLLGRKSPIYDIEHLQLFSPASLRRLLQAAGLERVEVRPVFNRYPVRYWAQLFPFPAWLKPRLVAGLAATGLGRLPLSLPAGNLAAVAFKSGR